MKKIISFLAVLVLIISCGDRSGDKKDVGVSIADTLLNKIETAPQFSAITDSSKLMVLQRNGKSVSYLAYKNSFIEEASMVQPSFKWEDMDADGNNEITTYSYTGGAHCCDVNTILTRTKENEMTEVLSFTGGTAISKDTVTLSFYEALGYFHTCYACWVDYPKAEVGPKAVLIFKNGKFSFAPTDESTNTDIETNLKGITAKGIPDKDSEESGGFDDGTRKAVAYNIVAWYFNNNRDLNATQQLFNKYYNHKDKATIWKDLTKSISYFDEDIKKGILLQ